MNDNLVPIRILHNRHPTDGCLGWLQPVSSAALFQLGIRFLEIIHFEPDCGSLIARRPFGVDIGDRKYPVPDVVFDPFAASDFFAWLEAKRFFVKSARASCPSPTYQ